MVHSPLEEEEWVRCGRCRGGKTAEGQSQLTKKRGMDVPTVALRTADLNGSCIRYEKEKGYTMNVGYRDPMRYRDQWETQYIKQPSQYPIVNAMKSNTHSAHTNTRQ
jgi:hypothetical protein